MHTNIIRVLYIEYPYSYLYNDFASFNTAKSSIVSSSLGVALGMTSSTTIADVATKIKAVQNRGAWTSKPTTAIKVNIPAGYHNGSGYVDATKISGGSFPVSLYIECGNAYVSLTIGGKVVFERQPIGEYGVWAGRTITGTFNA